MLLSVVSIWAVTAVLVLSAIQRISDGDYDIDSHIMLITSGCAVGVNVLWVRRAHVTRWFWFGLSDVLLKQFVLVQDGPDPPSVWSLTRPQSRLSLWPAAEGRAGTGARTPSRQRQCEGGVHSRGGRPGAKCRSPAGCHHHPLLGQCQPKHSAKKSLYQSKKEFINLYSLFWFLLFVKTVFLFSSQPEYKVADPICTFLFSVLVVGTTLPITKDVFRILMEGKHWVLVMKI